jgi:hypothetical protein
VNEGNANAKRARVPIGCRSSNALIWSSDHVAKPYAFPMRRSFAANSGSPIASARIPDRYGLRLGCGVDLDQLVLDRERHETAQHLEHVALAARHDSLLVVRQFVQLARRRVARPIS